MNALELLHQRVSVPAARLEAPAPEGDDLDAILQAAMSAPDHGGLTPWRFILIRGEARQRLGDVFAEAFRQRQPQASEEQVERQRQKPSRAPLIIAVVAPLQEHPKVPEIEQLLAAGAAVEHLQLAAQALGYGSVWLTGDNAYDWNVLQPLGLDMNEKLVGFVYMGTPAGSMPAKPRPPHAPRLSEWHGPQVDEDFI